MPGGDTPFPYKKDGGTGQKFCGHGLKFFSPQEEPILKQYIISCRILFGSIP